MAKAKKPVKKKSPTPSPFWSSSWADIDRTFDNFRRDLEKSFASFPAITMPSFPKMPETTCDIIDEGKQLRVKVDIPGVKKNEIDLNVTDNSVEISAKHKEEEEEKKKNYLRKERSQVSYYRTIPLPEKVLSGKTKAKLTDGVLNITLPKSKPTPKPKKKSVSVQ
ncbi:MAG: Hsp20/alpha crystallin family protein [Nitrosopumilaceae archaeon]